MAREINYSTETKSYIVQHRYTGGGYSDPKIQPVNDFEELNDIPLQERFIGLTVLVLNDGTGEAHEYWLKSSLRKWELKEYYTPLINILGNDVEKSEDDKSEERIVYYNVARTTGIETTKTINGVITQLN